MHCKQVFQNIPVHGPNPSSPVLLFLLLLLLLLPLPLPEETMEHSFSSPP